MSQCPKPGGVAAPKSAPSKQLRRAARLVDLTCKLEKIVQEATHLIEWLGNDMAEEEGFLEWEEVEAAVFPRRRKGSRRG